MDLGSGGRGGKKPLDMVINLVPFIDLMAVTIAFLIMTAVWTQVGAQQVAAPGSAGGDATAEQLPLTLLVTDKTVVLSLGATKYPAQQLSNLEPLARQLRELKAQGLAENSVTVQAEDGVRYEDLVRIIDACLGAHLDGVAVTPASG